MSAKAMRGILAASGMTHAALAERLETSRPRLTSYASGTMTPSADMFIDALNVSGVMRVRARAQTADSTAENITESDDLSDKFRWLLEGRDYLATASPLEAIVNWSSLRGELDANWTAFLAALVRPEFDRMNLKPPPWTQIAPLDPIWQPSARPFADIEADPGMLASGIRVRTKDLGTL